MKLINSIILQFLIFPLFARLVQPARTVQAQADQEAFLSWVMEQAIPLDIADPIAADLSGLDRFEPYLVEKRIILLGEPDHYVREKLEYQLLLIRYLHGMGFHYIGVEGGMAQGRILDRYMETGDRVHLERYRAREELVRPDRDDMFPILRAVLNSDRGRDLRDAGIWFLDRLYEISSGGGKGTERLHFFGFDLEPVPNLCYGEIDLLLEPWRSSPEVEIVLERLALVEGESRLEERDRIETIRSDVKNDRAVWAALLGRDRYSELEGLLRVLSESLENLDLAFTAPSSWLPDREEKIKRILDERLSSLPEDEKVILIAHNLHLARNSDGINVETFQLWHMLGTHLDRTYADEIYSIWMLYDHGRHGRVMSRGGGELIVEEVPSDPTRVEHLLARAGPVFLLPLGTDNRRAALLNGRLNFVQNGRRASAVLSEQTDAIFFVSEVSFIGERHSPLNPTVCYRIVPAVYRLTSP